MPSEFWTSTNSTRNSGRSGFKSGMKSTRGWWGNRWDLHHGLFIESKWRPALCFKVAPTFFRPLSGSQSYCNDTCGLLTERNPWWSIWRSPKTSKCTESTTSTSRIRKGQSCGWEWTPWGSTFMNRMTSKRFHNRFDSSHPPAVLRSEWPATVFHQLCSIFGSFVRRTQWDCANRGFSECSTVWPGEHTVNEWTTGGSKWSEITWSQNWCLLSSLY